MLDSACRPFEPGVLAGRLESSSRLTSRHWADDAYPSKAYLTLAGEQDPWLERDQMLDQILTDRGVAHQWNILPGGHEGPYWQRNIDRYPQFYDAALNRGLGHQPVADSIGVAG